MLRFALLLCIVTGSVTCNAQERTFKGRWNNRRTGSDGTMTCTASMVSPAQWTAVFRGSFQGKPFEYNVKFQSKESVSYTHLTLPTNREV